MPCGCFGKKPKPVKDKEGVKLDHGGVPPPVYTTGVGSPPGAPPPGRAADTKCRPEDDPDKASRRRDVVASYYSDQCELITYKNTGSRPPSNYTGSGETVPLLGSAEPPPSPPVATSSPAPSSPTSSRSGASCRAELAEKRREFFRELDVNGHLTPLSSSSTLPSASRLNSSNNKRPTSHPSSGTLPPDVTTRRLFNGQMEINLKSAKIPRGKSESNGIDQNGIDESGDSTFEIVVTDTTKPPTPPPPYEGDISEVKKKKDDGLPLPSPPPTPPQCRTQITAGDLKGVQLKRTPQPPPQPKVLSDEEIFRREEEKIKIDEQDNELFTLIENQQNASDADISDLMEIIDEKTEDILRPDIDTTTTIKTTTTTTNITKTTNEVTPDETKTTVTTEVIESSPKEINLENFVEAQPLETSTTITTKVIESSPGEIITKTTTEIIESSPLEVISSQSNENIPDDTLKYEPKMSLPAVNTEDILEPINSTISETKQTINDSLPENNSNNFSQLIENVSEPEVVTESSVNFQAPVTQVQDNSNKEITPQTDDNDKYVEIESKLNQENTESISQLPDTPVIEEISKDDHKLTQPPSLQDTLKQIIPPPVVEQFTEQSEEYTEDPSISDSSKKESIEIKDPLIIETLPVVLENVNGIHHTNGNLSPVIETCDAEAIHEEIEKNTPELDLIEQDLNTELVQPKIAETTTTTTTMVVQSSDPSAPVQMVQFDDITTADSAAQDGNEDARSSFLSQMVDPLKPSEIQDLTGTSSPLILMAEPQHHVIQKETTVTTGPVVTQVIRQTVQVADEDDLPQLKNIMDSLDGNHMDLINPENIPVIMDQVNTTTTTTTLVTEGGIDDLDLVNEDVPQLININNEHILGDDLVSSNTDSNVVTLPDGSVQTTTTKTEIVEIVPEKNEIIDKDGVVSNTITTTTKTTKQITQSVPDVEFLSQFVTDGSSDGVVSITTTTTTNNDSTTLDENVLDSSVPPSSS